MDILSFTTIILILFIIVGTYILVTTQIEGKPKIIILFSIILCISYIFLNLNVFISTTPKTPPVDAAVIINVPKIETPIPTSYVNLPESAEEPVPTIPLIDTTSKTFSLSTWIYITDWKSGENKTIFSMTNDISDYTPKIILDNYKNELIITYYTIPTISQNIYWQVEKDLNNVLNEYKNAKIMYIEASNKVGDSTNTIPQSQLISDTDIALTNLIETRKKYDGGQTGITSDLYQTIYTPNVITSKLNEDNTVSYDIISASVTENPINYDMYKIINEPTYIDYYNSALYNYNRITSNQTMSNPQVKWITGEISEDYSLETIKIPQIRIQKWMNIVISFGDNSVDTYLDGKLVDSHISTGRIQRVTSVENNTLLNWGGFTGLISSYNYIPKQLLPNDVLAIYKKGF